MQPTWAMDFFSSSFTSHNVLSLIKFECIRARLCRSSHYALYMKNIMVGHFESSFSHFFICFLWAIELHFIFLFWLLFFFFLVEQKFIFGFAYTISLWKKCVNGVIDFQHKKTWNAMMINKNSKDKRILFVWFFKWKNHMQLFMQKLYASQAVIGHLQKYVIY